MRLFRFFVLFFLFAFKSYGNRFLTPDESDHQPDVDQEGGGLAAWVRKGLGAWATWIAAKNKRDVDLEGDAATVHCNPAAATPPESKMEAADPVPWSSLYLFPLLVCAVVEGNVNGDTNACGMSGLSKLDLYFKSNTAPSVWISESLKPEDFSGPKKSHCRLVHASELATELRDQDLTKLEFAVKAKLYAAPADESQTAAKPTIKFTAHANSYKIDAPTTKDVAFKCAADRTVRAVVCSFPDCQVIAKETEGNVKATRTEYFDTHEGRTPVYRGTVGPVAQNMFSVTLWDCDPGNCPKTFSAVARQPQPAQRPKQQ